MLATTWSKPSATKPVIGRKTARTLPPMSSDAVAIHTARQTSQLHPMARKKITESVSVTAFPVAMVASRASGSGAPRTPVLTPRKYATNSAPQEVADQHEAEVVQQ